MTKKKGDKNITKPICQGVPSKVYLLAYGGKLHKYRIKQIIKYGWNGTGKRVNSNDIHRIINEYPNHFYQDIENKRVNEKGQEIILIKTYVEPLINEMELELKHKFDPDTRTMLHDFFDSPDFRNYIFEYVKNQSVKGYFDTDVNAFESIMVMTSYVARIAFLLKKSLDKKRIPLKVFKQKWKRIHKEINRRGLSMDLVKNSIMFYMPDEVKNKIKDYSNYNLIFNLAFRILELNYTSLEKLMKMQYTYDTLTMVDAALMAIPELVEKVK